MPISKKMESRVLSVKQRIQAQRQVRPFFQLEQEASQASLPPAFFQWARGRSCSVMPVLSPQMRKALEPLSSTERSHLLQALCLQDYTEKLPPIPHTPQERPQLLFDELLVDEYQILFARAEGAQAVCLSPSLLGPRRFQIYVNKIKFWHLEPVVVLYCAQELQEIDLSSARCVLLSYAEQPAVWAEQDYQALCRELRHPGLIRVACQSLKNALKWSDLGVRHFLLETSWWEQEQSLSATQQLLDL